MAIKKKQKNINLEKINLNKEEKVLINKINNRLIKLNPKIDEYFGEMETISLDSIISAFITNTDPDKMLKKYSDIIKEFELVVQKIKKDYNNLLANEDKDEVVYDNSFIEKFQKFVLNIGHLFLLRTKQEILKLIEDARVQSIVNEGKYNNIIKEYDLLMQDLDISTMNEDYITITSLQNDIEYLKNIKLKKEIIKTKLSYKQILLLVSAIVVLFIFLGIGIWLIVR